MKSLLFDLIATQPSGGTKRHGGGKYGEMVFFRMAERGIDFACIYDSRMWINPEVLAVCRERGIPLYDYKEQSVAGVVAAYGFGKVYSALPGMKFAGLPEDFPKYGTLHGMRALEMPKDVFSLRYRTRFREVVKYFVSILLPGVWEGYFRKKYIRGYFNSGLRLITVSEHSRHAFSVWFPEYHGEVKTFYSPNTSRDTDLPAPPHSGNVRYLLLVSGNRWEKNNLRAIIAFDRLISDNLIDASIRMKITGCSPRNFRYKIKNADRFDFLGYVDEDELDRLYANAYLFVYPTLNEGFGYPPLEAMKYKTPVIASPFSSIAEVCAEGVLFFNPFSIEEIMNRILMMMYPHTHDEYAEKGYGRYLQVKARQDADLDALIDYITGEKEE